MISILVFSTLGIAYANLPQVNTGDTLDASSWNNVVDSINNFGFDSGNVGIGTDSPTANLEIVGSQGQRNLTIQGNTQPRIDLDSSVSGANDWNILNEGNIDRFSIRQTGNGQAIFSIEGGSPSHSLGIKSTGTVTIGTDTGDATLKLDVEGKIGATEYCDEDGNNCTLASNLGSGGGGSGKFVDGTDTNDAAFTGGNVGLGTNNPRSQLHVGTASHLFTAGTSNLHLGQNIYFDGTGYTRSINDNDSSLLYMSGANGDIIFYGNSDSNTDIGSPITLKNNFTIKKNGDIGIGTTTPNAKLNINAYSNSQESSAISFYPTTNINGLPAYSIGMGPTSSQGFMEYRSGTGDSSLYGHKFMVNGIERMRINGQGRVAIGNINPSGTLHVVGTSSRSAIFQGDTNVYNTVSSTTGYARIWYQEGGSWIGSVGGNGNGKFTLASGGGNGPHLVIDTTGYIGLGTQTPTSKLQVIGLPVYADNTATKSAGLTNGAFYHAGDGIVRVVY